MKILNGIFYKLPSNLLACFSGIYLLWHLVAIGLTYVIVTSGFDWKYFSLFAQPRVFVFMLPAAIVGFVIPIFLPIAFLIFGRHNPQTQNIGLATAQAAFLAWLISSGYKLFTGRVPPELWTRSGEDISRIFKFGWFRGGIFWGWPSSHATVAFAVVMTLLIMYPKNKIVWFAAVFYALYVGIGISVSIHWFSDFLAGAIIGTIIGIIVGQSFQKRFV